MGTTRCFRPQDVIAMALILVFLMVLVITLRHLQREWRTVLHVSDQARLEYTDMVAATGGLPDRSTIARLDHDIDALLRSRNKTQDGIEQEQQVLDADRFGMAATVTDASHAGFVGSGPWNPGPEPSLWFRRLRPEWIAWDARRRLCEDLNGSYWAQLGRIHGHQSALRSAALALHTLDETVEAKRAIRATVQSWISDPHPMSRMNAVTAGSVTARLLVLSCHLPLIVYAILVCVHFTLRLALMREWLPTTKLAHAH